MTDRTPIEQPESWMRWTEGDEDDHDSCLWCDHICQLSAASTIYICSIHKVYYSQDSDLPQVLDKVRCGDFIKDEKEEMGIFEGVEENRGTPPTNMLFTYSFS